MLKSFSMTRVLFLCLLFLVTPHVVEVRADGPTTRVSVGASGDEGNGDSSQVSISADGHFVAFYSDASNLVPDDSNSVGDVFEVDLQTGQTTRVSVSSSGEQGDSYSSGPAISADGRYVAFDSYASNLVPNEPHGGIFVHDRQTGETTLVSVSSSGEAGNRGGGVPSISADGRYIAFESEADNLVPDDNNNTKDIFVHDRQTGETTLVSVSTDGMQGDEQSVYSSISADGRYVAFNSYASTLVPDDQNLVSDVFVHDLQTGETTRISVSSAGEQMGEESSWPSISSDGRFVVFMSNASNLVPDDTNDATDVFVYEIQTAEIARVSLASGGEQANRGGGFGGYSISADGRFVAFSSSSRNLVPGDSYRVDSVFVFDRQSQETTRVSVSRCWDSRERLERGTIDLGRRTFRCVRLKSDGSCSW